MPRRKALTGLALAASLAGAVLFRRRSRRRDRVDALLRRRHDALAERRARPRLRRCSRSPGGFSRPPQRLSGRRAARRSPARARLPRRGLRPSLRQALQVLPRQVPLRDRPDLLEALGARLAAAVAEAEPEAARLAGPELGAVALAAAASLASRLPFLIVRGEAKEYGTANRLEGAYEAGDRVVLIEDVVTSGGAAADAVRALRQAALECRTAICVVDREEGGADALLALACDCVRSFVRPKSSRAGSVPQKRLVERKVRPDC